VALCWFFDDGLGVDDCDGWGRIFGGISDDAGVSFDGSGIHWDVFFDLFCWCFLLDFLVFLFGTIIFTRFPFMFLFDTKYVLKSATIATKEHPPMIAINVGNLDEFVSGASLFPT
jgi:hypothetical protein